MPIDDINGKSYKTELKSSSDYSTNNLKSISRCQVIYGLWGVHTHTHAHTHTHTYFGGMKVIIRNQAHAGMGTRHVVGVPDLTTHDKIIKSIDVLPPKKLALCEILYTCK